MSKVWCAVSASLTDTPTWLAASSGPLWQRYDVALLDLDGVVYVGRTAVPGAPHLLARARAHGMRLAFVTNNASRTPRTVAEHLSELGVPATPADVTTSGQTAGDYLGEHLPAGSRVLVLGAPALAEEVTANGLVPVETTDQETAAVVQGFSPELGWRALAEGAVAIERGALWVATNADRTHPSARGPLPGNGSLVAALAHATGRAPVVVGKPNPAMHQASIQRSSAQRPVVVGDRLDTDIEGANAAGCASLLVLSGSTDAAHLLAARVHQRPSFIARDVGGLLSAHPRPVVGPDGVSCGSWRVRADGGSLQLVHRPVAVGAASEPDSDLDALRALCAASWTHSDVIEQVTGSEVGSTVLRRLGLTS